MIRPTPSSTARRSSADDLLLPWKPIRAGSKPARSATASSPPEQTSRQSPSSRHPAGHRGAEERLAGVEDVVAGERVAERAGPGPEVGLVEDVRRGAVLGDQLGQRHPADLEDAVDLARGRRPQVARPARWGRRAGAARTGPAGRRRRAPSRPRGRPHIRSGAETPSRPRPLASTVRVAATSTRRASLTGADRLVALRQHPALAGVVPLVEDRGRVLEVARDPVRLAQLGRAGDHPRELGQRAQQLALELVGEQRRVEVRPRRRAATCRGRRRSPSSGRCGRGRTARSRPGCRWTPSPTGRGRGRCWSPSCSGPARSGRRRRRWRRRGRRW